MRWQLLELNLHSIVVVLEACWLQMKALPLSESIQVLGHSEKHCCWLKDLSAHMRDDMELTVTSASDPLVSLGFSEFRIK